MRDRSVPLTALRFRVPMRGFRAVAATHEPPEAVPKDSGKTKITKLRIFVFPESLGRPCLGSGAARAGVWEPWVLSRWERSHGPPTAAISALEAPQLWSPEAHVRISGLRPWASALQHGRFRGSRHGPTTAHWGHEAPSISRRFREASEIERHSIWGFPESAGGHRRSPRPAILALEARRLWSPEAHVRISGLRPWASALQHGRFMGSWYGTRQGGLHSRVEGEHRQPPLGCSSRVTCA